MNDTGIRARDLLDLSVGRMHGYQLGPCPAGSSAAAVWAIVAQNAPLYDEDGGDEFFATMAGYWQDGSDEHRNASRVFLTPETTRAQYLVSVADPSLVDPDSWLVDQALLDRPGVDEVMLDYLYDIRNPVSTNDAMREFLRAHQPPALIATGANDALFSPQANIRHWRAVMVTVLIGGAPRPAGCCRAPAPR